MLDPRLPYRVKLQRITLDDGTSALRYEPQTRHRPLDVVLTHGLTASAAGLDLLAAYLAGHGYRTIAIDLPGHKLGCTGGALTTVDQAVAAIDAAMARLPSPRVALVGHSFGAGASTVSARHPRVAALAIVAAGAFGRRDFTGPVGTTMRDARSDYVTGLSLPELLSAMQLALSGPLDYLQNRRVLIVGASQDAIVSRADIEAWAARVPHGQVDWVNATHMDAPVAARAIIGRWLDLSVELLGEAGHRQAEHDDAEAKQ